MNGSTSINIITTRVGRRSIVCSSVFFAFWPTENYGKCEREEYVYVSKNVMRRYGAGMADSDQFFGNPNHCRAIN